MALTVDQLYAQYGKTPDMIDQQGRDFWGNMIASGAPNVADAFRNSATDVYSSNQFAPENRAGFQNWTGNLSSDQVVDYNSMYGNSGYQGSSAWESMDPTLRAGIMSGNVDVNTLSEAQRAAIPSAQTMYGGGDNNHPAGQSGGGAPSLNAYQQNPYLAQMGEGLRNQFAQFRDDGLAANRGGAVAAGGVGGSRQGIMEARTMTDAGKGFDSALANLYGQDYNNQMNRNLQKYQGDQNYALGNLNSDRSYNLGLGGLDLQSRGQDMNFYGQQRAQDQSGMALGASLYGLGSQGPWNSLTAANNLAAPYTSNGTTVNTGTQGGGALGAVGGALGAAQLWNNISKSGSGNSSSWW